MKKKQRWVVPVALVGCSCLGLFAGYIGRGESHAPAESEPGSGTPGPDTHEIDAEARKRMGVETAKLTLQSYAKSRSITGSIIKTSRSDQPLEAPIGGRVLEILVEPGMKVGAGQPLLRLLRDPIPRPELVFTAEILRPAQEKLHESVIELRRAKADLAITLTELKRVSAYTEKGATGDLPVVPRKMAIDLRYQKNRFETAYRQAQLELMKHGFTEAQIEGLAEGGKIPGLGEDNWKRALKRNGLWPASAEALFAALDDEVRSLPWVVASIGELAARGLASSELASWLRADPRLGRHFVELCVLLQMGHSLEDLKQLHSLGALEPVVVLRAPGGGGAPDLDVQVVDVRVGAHVERGKVLLSLMDPRELYLRIDPVGGEIAAASRALKAGLLCKAMPLIPASGPALDGLEILRLDASGGETLGYLRVKNQVLGERKRGASIFRSWKLREGLRYRVQVPTEILNGVFVVPVAAILEESGEDFVLLDEDGDFEMLPVHVSYRDDQFAVLHPHEGEEPHPGDSVVVKGAFALGLALKKSGNVDPHAGHKH